jgi:hypothetical protein
MAAAQMLRSGIMQVQATESEDFPEMEGQQILWTRVMVGVLQSKK